MSAFDAAVAFTLGQEGGEVADKGGGDTKFGIARRYHPDITDEQWARFSLEDAKIIYRVRYWNVIKGDNLPPVLALVLFDCAVNPGPAWAGRTLQRLLGIAQDGVIGQQTIAATWEKSAPVLAAQLLAERILRYAGDEEWETYKRGWTRRSFAALTAALALA